MEFDILIKNGLLADGSGASLFEADVGATGELISQVGNLKGKTAAEEIDASGMVVAPGFIDIHGHSDYFILVEPSSLSKLLQGVTTEISGNCGYSAAPASDELNEQRAESLDSNFGIRPDWNSLAGYHEKLEGIRPAINIGNLIGHNTVRASVMRGEARPPDEGESARMKEMICDAMAQGAFGISTGLIYPPACFSDVEELAMVCAPVAESGGFFAAHMRSEGAGLIESLAEVMEASKRAGIQLQVSHFKASGPKNWDKLDKAIDMLDRARSGGLDVRCDRYPYTASFTGLSAVLPAWVFEGSREEFRHRLTLPEVRDKIRREVPAENGEDYLDRVVIAQVFDEKARRFEGLSVTEAARRENAETFDFLCELLSAQTSDPTAIFHTMSEPNMARILNLPYACVASDSAVRAKNGPLASGKPHPRAYGCFPRMLRLAREEKIMPMEVAVRKMTADAAKTAGISGRGRLKPGFFADIVVFDPDKVSDTATYDNPHQYPEGINLVLVNGKIAAAEGEPSSGRFGKILKKSN